MEKSLKEKSLNKKTKNPQDPLIVIYDDNEMNEQNELPPVLIQECNECNQEINPNEINPNGLNPNEKRQSLYNVEQQSEDIMDFLARPVEDTMQIIEMDEEQGTDEENQSTDDEQVEAMIELIDPEMISDLMKLNPSENHRINSKMLFDHKIVSPYLMSVFVNGHLDTNQCAMLKDRKSRRQLFYILN